MSDESYRSLLDSLWTICHFHFSQRVLVSRDGVVELSLVAAAQRNSRGDDTRRFRLQLRGLQNAKDEFESRFENSLRCSVRLAIQSESRSYRLSSASATTAKEKRN